MAIEDPSFEIDITTIVTVNELLEIQFVDDPDTVTYYSRVNDISAGRLVIAWPTHAGIRMLVHRDQILKFYFKYGGVPHRFTGLVDEVNPRRLPQIALIPSSPITRVQRRQNFRIKCAIPVEIAGSIRDPKDGSVSPLNLQTVTADLSAGGIAIKHTKMIPEDTPVEIKLLLPDSVKPIKLPCRVVYCNYDSESLTTYRMGLCYLAINESERARIVRFVYRTQLSGVQV